MASELKPCPFCGGSNLSFRSTPDMDTDGKFHRISCNECGAGSREKFAMETCPLFYEELRSAWNTRPAPAATDTGLVTVAWQDFVPSTGWVASSPSSIAKDKRELVTRSQAEELLAAERAETERLADDYQAIREQLHRGWRECKDLKAELAEALRGNRYAQLERIAVQRAEKAEADNAALIHDLNRIKDHETELVNDNAAQAARIKELEAELENGGRVKGMNTQYANALAYLEMTEDDDPEEFAKRIWDEREALEAKLAAAEKALETYKAVVKDVCESQRGTKWGKCAECIFDAIERAALGGKPSC